MDAVADSEPIGTLLVAGGKVKNIADQAKDAPYKDEYCCEVIVSGKFLAANPKAAAAATRALLKAAKWVQTNPAAAARLSVEKKYLASNPELNTVAISHLNYIPSVSLAEASVKSAAVAMKADGMLSPSTDVDDLAKRAFVHLDGVSDEWINSLQVEKVAGGQLPPDENARLLAELSHSTVTPTEYGEMSCCRIGQHQVNMAPQDGERAGSAARMQPCPLQSKAQLRSLLPCRWRLWSSLGVHWIFPNNELPNEARLYSQFLRRCSRRGPGRRRDSVLLAGVAAVDAEHVPHRCRGILTLCVLGIDHRGLALAAATVFSCPGGGAAKHGG